MSVGRFTSYNLIGAAIPLALTFFTVPVYLALVGIDRVGILSLAWLLLGYFGLFDLGLGKATAFRIAGQRDAKPEERATTLWAALIVNVGMGLIGGLILWAVSYVYFTHFFKVTESLRPEIISAVPLLALSVPVATLTGVLTGALQGREKFLESNKISTISTILFQLAPLCVAWLWSQSLVWLLASALLTRGLTLIALWRLCSAEFTAGHKPHVDRVAVKALLGYGGWVSFNGLIGPFLVIFDRFAIGAVLGATSLGYYYVPFQIAKQLAIIPGSLTGAMFPKLTIASPEASEALSRKAIMTLIAVITVPVLVGMMIFDPFLTLWVGRTIAVNAATVGRVLLIAFWCNAMALVPFTQLQAAGKPRIVTVILALQIPFYMAALYFGMVWFGVVGCAIALALRMGADFVMQSCGVNGKVECAGPILGMLILLIAMAFATSWLATFSAAWWGSSTLLILAGMIASWWAMPHDVRNQLLATARRWRPNRSHR